METYQGPLLRYAVRFCGDWELARDVVQDTFLALCRARRAEVERHLAAWLFTVCRNRALDVRRKEARMSPLTESQALGREDRSPSPAIVAEQKAAYRSVCKALDELPERQREVLRLKFQEGFSYQEIGRVTGLSISNVGFLIHTAIRALRRQLAEAPEEMSHENRAR
jgi:RNA polymerase sigma-70 factor (ECF subfamily)